MSIPRNHAGWIAVVSAIVSVILTFVLAAAAATITMLGVLVAQEVAVMRGSPELRTPVVVVVVERPVKIDQTGKVGLGTSTPNLPLIVFGAPGYPAYSGSTATGVVRIITGGKVTGISGVGFQGYMMATIKELAAEIDALKARVKALEAAKIEAMK